MQTSVAYKETHAGELPRAGNRPSLSKSHSWFWLAIGAVLLLFSNGANNVPLAAWLAATFVLRFVREQRLAIGLPIAYALLMAGVAFQFRGVVPIPGVRYYIFLLIFGL